MRKKYNNREANSVLKKNRDKWRENIFGGLAIAVVTTILVGIINSMCKDFYDSCAVVINNASVGFSKKVVDLYYVVSARAELTDGANDTIWCVRVFLIAALWLLRDAYKNIAIDGAEGALNKTMATMSKIDSIAKKSAASTNEEDNLTSLRNEVQRLRDLCKKNLAHLVNQYRYITCGVILATIMFVFLMSLTHFAYAKLKDYRQQVVAVRPFITEQEFHLLNRQWTFMSSKSEYIDLMNQLSAYAKRARECTSSGSIYESGKNYQ